MKNYNEFLKEGLFSNTRKELKKRMKEVGLGMWQWGIDNKEKNIGKFVIVGDYSSTTSTDSKDLYRFLQSNVGEITLASKSGYGISYMVKYDNIPPDLQHWFSQNPVDYIPRYLVCMDQHLEFIGSYEECKTYIDAKTYNL